MGSSDSEAPADKAAEIKELLEYVKANYPVIEPLVVGRINHWKRRYAGVFGAAIVACEIVAQVIG